MEIMYSLVTSMLNYGNNVFVSTAITNLSFTANKNKLLKQYLRKIFTQLQIVYLLNSVH